VDVAEEARDGLGIGRDGAQAEKTTCRERVLTSHFRFAGSSCPAAGWSGAMAPTRATGCCRGFDIARNPWKAEPFGFAGTTMASSGVFEMGERCFKTGKQGVSLAGQSEKDAAAAAAAAGWTYCCLLAAKFAYLVTRLQPSP